MWSAMSLSLQRNDICSDDKDSIKRLLHYDILQNFEFYTNSPIPLFFGITNNKKSYTFTSVDLMISSVSSVYDIGITVIRVGPSGKVSLLQQDPRNASPHSRRIFLYQSGEGNNTHYDAITGVTAEHPVMQACLRPHSDTGAIGVSAPSDTGANAAPVPSDTNIIVVPTPSDNASLLPPPPQTEAPLMCLSDTGDTDEELMMVSSI